jgi:hypothetical protein
MMQAGAPILTPTASMTMISMESCITVSDSDVGANVDEGEKADITPIPGPDSGIVGTEGGFQIVDDASVVREAQLNG